ncbi:hypothetical protein HT136_01410 [Novosphingobium profundi]|uniref:hypothetical protein n=1 Tax=Novosphingobium profundi TaxID=1774954 RepID=UPI001BD92F59|nr:hypothetical protein [Novosphingobium profundi]MBT0667024.1 hypothetical protein [Novosphingobium profundi]
MADRYVAQQVGVADGTQVPSARADGRQVGAHRRTILASKVTGVAWAIADRVFLGKKRVGETIVGIRLCTDTSLGTATVDVGNDSTADKYVDGALLTATNVPTALGPKASTLDDGPATEDEEIWATIGVAAIAAATVLTFEIELCGA